VKSRSSEINGFSNVLDTIECCSGGQVDCSKYEQQRHQKDDHPQWTKSGPWYDQLLTGRLAETLSGVCVSGPLKVFYHVLRSHVMLGNETPVCLTSIWCIREQKANAVPESMKTRGRTWGLGKWDVLLHWGLNKAFHCFPLLLTVPHFLSFSSNLFLSYCCLEILSETAQSYIPSVHTKF